MEDQQPETGAVTGAVGASSTEDAVEETAAATTDAATTDAGETDAGETEPGETEPGETEPGETEPGETEPGEESVPPKGTRGRMIAAGVAVGAALFVGAAGYAGAAVQPYLADRALVATKLDIARAASDAITALWTYTPEDIGTLADRAAQYLAGDMAAQYRKYIEAIEAQYSQAQVSLDSEVVGVAVAGVDDEQARALVYTNSTWSSPQKKDIPGLLYASYQVSLRRDGHRWLVTGLDPITSFSLRPQF